MDATRDDARFHSHGTFTLQRAALRASLGRFQLPPGFFLAKWVQAAVALGVDRVRLELASEFKVTLVGSGPVPLKVERFLEGLENPLSLPPGCAEAHLATGILGTQAERPRSVRMHLKDPAGDSLIHLHGEEAEIHRLPASGGDWSLQLDLAEPGQLEASLQVLHQRCGFAPLDLEFNGRVLQIPGLGLPDSWLAAGYFPGHQRSRLKLPEAEAQRALFVDRQGRIGGPKTDASLRMILLCPLEEDEFKDCSAYLVISLQPELRSRICWVKSGVLVEEEQVDLGTPGVTAVVSADFLETDLSQVSLLRNEAYQARLALLRDQAAWLLARVLACPLDPEFELPEPFGSAMQRVHPHFVERGGSHS